MICKKCSKQKECMCLECRSFYIGIECRNIINKYTLYSDCPIYKSKSDCNVKIKMNWIDKIKYNKQYKKIRKEIE